MKITYTPEAIDDLKKLREFIEVKNSSAAQRAATAILKGISQLKTFPYFNTFAKIMEEKTKDGQKLVKY